MYDLEDYERVVWREKGALKRFIKEFLCEEGEDPSKYSISQVLWDTVSMAIHYVDLDTREYITTTFGMPTWEEYYNRMK